MHERIILEAERKRMTGISRTTAWRMEKNGQYPKRRKVSDGLVGWLESELDEWIANRQLVS